MKNTKNIGISYIVFLMVFYLIIFRELLETYIPYFGYIDEMFALMAFPIAFMNLYANKGKIKKIKNKIPKLLIVFLIIGMLGNYVYKYQSIMLGAVPDLILNLKFWFSIYVSINLFRKVDIDIYGKRISFHVKLVTILYIVLIILDIIYDIFPGDVRYGIKSTQLFYSIHTLFAAICGFLAALLVMTEKHFRRKAVYIIILLMLMLSTMRVKAFGAVLLFVLLCFLIYQFKAKIKVWHIICLALLCMVVGWSQIQYYFFSDISDKGARAMLLKNCFLVAKDHFPFGSGFATYGSHFSGVLYSPVYVEYGLSNIFGLTSYYPVYVSDSFWPMIIAQNGYIGAIFFILALIALFMEVQKVLKIDRDAYMAGIFSLAYLCVSSLAEAAFVNSLSVPFAIIIGMSIIRNKKTTEQ